MDVLPILNVLLVHIVRLDPIGAMPTGEELHEAGLELRTEVRDVSASILADGEHGTQVTL